jgi:hypothetical protein
MGQLLGEWSLGGKRKIRENIMTNPVELDYYNDRTDSAMFALIFAMR